MKKIILSAAAVMSMATISSAGDDLGKALKEGKFSVDARVFYFNRDFADSTSTIESLTAGGILKYESADFYGVKAGVAAYSSNRIGGFIDADKGASSGNLEAGTGDNLNFIGEAYLQYNVDKTMVKVGRQQLNTPILNKNDVRTIPTVYEAAIVENKNIANTTIQLGYVVSQTGFGSKFNDFDKNEANWGDSGLASLYVTNNSFKPLKVRAQYIKMISDDYTTGGAKTDIAYTDYKYLDFKYSVPFGKKTYVCAQYLGNDYKDQDDSMVLGAKVGTSFGIVNLAAVYVQVFDNNYKKVASSSVYTDWQQGYGLGPSKAVGAIISAKPMKNLSVMARYVDITPDDYSSNAGANSNNENTADDMTETNFDATYVFNDWSKIRFRYSIVDKRATGGEDRNDFRTIYYIHF